MRLYSGNKWKEGFADYSLTEGSMLVQPFFLVPLKKLEDLYFVRKPELSRLTGYIRELGIKAVTEKIKSRLSESIRNEKYFLCGLGTVKKSACDKFAEGAHVVFALPAAPKAAERLLVNGLFAKACSPEITKKFSEDSYLLLAEKKDLNFCDQTISRLLNNFEAWEPDSGIKLEQSEINNFLDNLLSVFSESKKPAKPLRLPIRDSQICNSLKPQNIPKKTTTSFTAQLYGLGNYAKTQILPNLPDYIKMEFIHEKDTAQLGNKNKYSATLTTSADFKPDSDIYFIAGYHHTHASLAIQALQQDSAAVVEKPLVTSRKDLALILEAMKTTEGRLFTCYHMRHNPLFKQAKKDLSKDGKTPLNMNACVFETPLPAKHWYNWPNSRSHIVSNGCHWLDLFLFLNDYSKPRDISLKRLGEKDSLSAVILENGAYLVLHLTHQGSARIGVQDLVSLRSHAGTATVKNASSYSFESQHSLLRQIKFNRADSYRIMYKEICENIKNKTGGETPETVSVLNNLILDLDALYFSSSDIQPKD